MHSNQPLNSGYMYEILPDVRCKRIYYLDVFKPRAIICKRKIWKIPEIAKQTVFIFHYVLKAIQLHLNRFLALFLHGWGMEIRCPEQ